jgi:hypothetical protein
MCTGIKHVYPQSANDAEDLQNRRDVAGYLAVSERIQDECKYFRRKIEKQFFAHAKRNR